MDLFWTVGFYLMFFLIIYWHYGQMAVTVVRWTKPPQRVAGSGKVRRPPMSFKERWKCYIPIYQACVVRKALYGSYGPFLVMTIISAVCILARLLNTFLLPINSYVMFATSIMVYIGVILHLLIYAIITADCARMYGCKIILIVACFIFPQLACYWVNNIIPNKMRAMYKEETFDGTAGATQIKQRNS